MKQKVCYILSKPYRILDVEPGCAPDFVGTNSRDMQTITLRDDIANEAREDTILHEAIHIISDELCLKLSEEQVGALACGLYSAGCRVKI